MSAARWHKVHAGLYELETSATGRYVVEFNPQKNMWGLSYEGAYSQSNIHYFFTLRRAKDYVAGIGGSDE